MTTMGRSAIPFVVIGGACVVAGGLVSAATAASPGYTASWAVAFLVLVAGAGQLALGLAQAWLVGGRTSRRLIAVEATTFTVANAAILVGTLTASPVLVDAGGGLFIVSLAAFLWGVRGPGPGKKRVLYGFRALIAVLIVSTPIGLIIASVRAS